MTMKRLAWLMVAAVCAAAPLTARQQQTLPSETPATFNPVTSSFDYERRVVMTPMRDGVKLHTVILVPKGATHAPILLTRTPYDADSLTTHAESAHLGPILQGYDNATDVIVDGGYIRVVQDIRGKYHSEGDFVMNRPLRGPLNPTDVDESTDTYDTIEWLVNHVPESNGKVGILGISYDGFLPLMALVHPHPALKVAVPMNPMVDGWRGDDWFHNGAFREQMMSYIYVQEAARSNDVEWWLGVRRRLRHVHAGGLRRRTGTEARARSARLLAQDPRAPELRRVLARAGGRPDPRPRAAECADACSSAASGTRRTFTARPPSTRRSRRRTRATTWSTWRSARGITGRRSPMAARSARSGSGAIRRSGSAQHVLAPFLAHYLKDGAPPMDVAPVTAFETGTNRVGTAEGLAARPGAEALSAGGAQGRLHRAGRGVTKCTTSTSPIRPSRSRTGRGPAGIRIPAGIRGSWAISAKCRADPTCWRSRPIR